MNLLAKSCFAPGIISFISNLITSMGDEDDMDTQNDEPKWESEYKEGLDHEIYRCALSPKLENKYFSEVLVLEFR